MAGRRRQWIFKDFSTPAAPTILPRMNQKGLLERDLTPRKAITFFQSYWRKSPWRTSTALLAHPWGQPREQNGQGLFNACRRTVCQWRIRGVKQRDTGISPPLACAG